MKKKIIAAALVLPMLSGTAQSFAQWLSSDSVSEIEKRTRQAEQLNELGWLIGTDEGYELDRTVTRAEAITLLMRIFPQDSAETALNFEDVDSSYWGYSDISAAAANGIIHGVETDEGRFFYPDRGVTGQEFLKMFKNASGDIVDYDDAISASENLITDMYVNAAVYEGSALSRADVVGICWQYASDSSLFDDTEVISSGDSLLYRLNSLMPEDENYMFSPLSIKLALAMTANGANGDTYTEIADALGINISEYNEYARELIDKYADYEDLSLEIANSIWLNSDYTDEQGTSYKDVAFKPSFTDTAGQYFDAAADIVGNDNAVSEINSWISGKTHEKITEIIQDNKFLAALINSVYFKGEWQSKFNEYSTYEEEFTNRDGSVSAVQMMHKGISPFGYYEDDSFSMVELDYSGSSVSMYIALPKEGLDRQDIDYTAYIDKAETTVLRLSIPKFTFDYSDSLVDELKTLGMELAFDPNNADFSKMFDNIPALSNVYINDVIHKTHIDVDENGTEAAAVTASVMVGATSASPIDTVIEFKADRPFTFIIYDRDSSEVLFMGEVSDMS